MLIGIISDTHDDSVLFEKAIKKFNTAGVEIVFHCGDWSSLFPLEIIEKLNCEIFSVFGNNDMSLFKYEKKSIGKVYFAGNWMGKKIDQQRIAVCHGDSISLLNSLLKSGKYDAVFSGHTHKPLIKEVNRSLHINPGTASFSWNNTPSIAIYNTTTRLAKSIFL